MFFIFFVILGLVTSHRSFTRSLQKKRKRSFGDEKLPTSWEDLKTVLDQFLKTNSGEDFTVMNKIINNAGARIMGFMSSSLLAVLKCKPIKLKVKFSFQMLSIISFCPDTPFNQ